MWVLTSSYSMEVPLAYLDIIERFYRNRDMQRRLTIIRARRILGAIYHFEKKKVMGILKEMQKMKLIIYNNQWLDILWKPKPL